VGHVAVSDPMSLGGFISQDTRFMKGLPKVQPCKCPRVVIVIDGDSDIKWDKNEALYSGY